VCRCRTHHVVKLSLLTRRAAGIDVFVASTALRRLLTRFNNPGSVFLQMTMNNAPNPPRTAAVCEGAQSLRLLIVMGFPGASPIFAPVAP
jgi:hypothetical protein